MQMKKQTIKDISENHLKQNEKIKKQILGQFYTTNYKEILDGLDIPDNIDYIIEPFAGSGDLLNFLVDDEKYQTINVECYDIDPKKDYIIKKDTIKNPPIYNDKFILTNPPFLARNKSKDKTLYDKYGVNDLFKCFIKEIITNKALGGIVIIPLNFWCSIRKADIALRKAFLNVYDVLRINIFENRVFDDTSSAITCFHFMLKQKDGNHIETESKIHVVVYPSKAYFDVSLNDENNYLFGGEIYNLPQNNNIKIDRLTKKNIKTKEKYITNLFIKCLDDSYDNKLGMKMVPDNKRYIDDTEKLTARSFATLIIEPKISKTRQIKLVKEFNNYLLSEREKYNSLFLTNYRENKDIARKRISFNLVYKIVNYLLSNTN